MSKRPAFNASLVTIISQITASRMKLEEHLSEIENDISAYEGEDEDGENSELEAMETLKAGLEDTIDNLDTVEFELNGLIEE